MDLFIGLMLSVVLNLFLLVKVGGRLVQGKENTVTEEEIRQMVDAGGDNGSIDENEKEMINNIFELGNLSAGSIATHRTDIVAVPLDATLEDIKNVTAEEKYSRIVV
ncbi:MAG: HlyC/CorC family transporter, partial [Anaerotignum sp.]|nr:HlyC/CorC family transporter [Anaerotignum sp.]